MTLRPPRDSEPGWGADGWGSKELGNGRERESPREGVASKKGGEREGKRAREEEKLPAPHKGGREGKKQNGCAVKR
jgi:hypothetical protein